MASDDGRDIWSLVARVAEEEEIADQMAAELHARKEHMRYGGLLLSRYDREATEKLRQANSTIKSLASVQREISSALENSSAGQWIDIETQGKENFVNFVCSLPRANDLLNENGPDVVKKLASVAPECSDWVAERDAIKQFASCPATVLKSIQERQALFLSEGVNGLTKK